MRNGSQQKPMRLTEKSIQLQIAITNHRTLQNNPVENMGRDVLHNKVLSFNCLETEISGTLSIQPGTPKNQN